MTSPTPRLLAGAGLAVAATLALALPALSLPAAAGPAAGSAPRATRPDTIVSVEGDRLNGFTITYHDGSSISPPTDSEARAECGEYDTRVARVRCRTEVRVWYRDLGALQRALELAHQGG